MSNQKNHIKPKSIIGLGLIVFALMMLFDNLGFHIVGKVLSNWPIALILIGGSMLYLSHKKDGSYSRNGHFPYFLIGFGVLFFLAQHHFFNFSFGSLIGPAILLAIGIHILRPDSEDDKRRKSKQDNAEKHFTENVSENITEDLDEEIGILIEGEVEPQNSKKKSSGLDDDHRIDVFSILGGSEVSTYSKGLTGGNIVCILGGAVIDIREADAAGDTIEVDILTFMGGAEIKVPHHWQVSVKAIPILGGVSNKTTCLADKLQLPKKHLIISGLTLMGGIDIRN